MTKSGKPSSWSRSDHILESVRAPKTKHRAAANAAREAPGASRVGSLLSVIPTKFLMSRSTGFGRSMAFRLRI